MGGLLDRAKHWARTLKRDVAALWIAGRDPRTPTAAKIVTLAVAAYALSPIDLIPDFIPVLGYLDDLLIVPLGVMLAIRLIPPHLMQEYRVGAALLEERPSSRSGLMIVIGIWIVALGAAAWFFRSFSIGGGAD